ncbi:probable non-F420 flavinoid oxidoreductase [Parapedobacter composti]|uniref:Probable non-F420 flavinoid oxidoreductase n=1 Tax=Parapedobacter composti TaxID=623281 RepID=A0A1I1IJ24_9SPHI|nr:TIGR03885 family FMN-dependent LLM class oxidoreductase [Parapedobacter composti]SFC35971.1 probable non-F420 flavinoid oxidoreductase [Parapedobacter composti]
MKPIAFHASHEQFSPSALLRYALLAQQAGFNAIHSSDHFQPWSHRQGQSGHAFSWLGAAMQQCSLPFGLICAPGPRHHPAIVAQSIATLTELFPDRLWVALGSGEAINERITGQPWPSKTQRNERLLECFDIIHRLLDGQTVTHRGRVCAEEARLYTLPRERPRLLGAAITEETAHWMGSWAEGLLTISQPPETLDRVITRFRDGGGVDKPVYVKVQLSYARDKAQAVAGAFDQWRTNIFDSSILADLWRPEQFESLAAFVKQSDLEQSVHISNDINQHAEWLNQYLSMGVDGLILHNVNREQEAFIEDFGQSVIPQLKTA